MTKIEPYEWFFNNRHVCLKIYCKGVKESAKKVMMFSEIHLGMESYRYTATWDILNQVGWVYE